MAITSVNLNDEVLCRDLYLNFYKYDNTRDIEMSVISQIEARYCNEVGNYEDANGNVITLPKLEYWNMMAEDDINQYEFTDEDWDFANTTGASKGQDVSGTDGNRTASNVHTAADGAGTVGAMGALGGIWGHGLFKNVGHFADKAHLKASLKGNPNGASNAGACAYVAAGIVIAVAALYYVKKPNKEEIAALSALNQQYANYISNLQAQQAKAQEQIANMEEISADSEAIKEGSNQEVIEIATFEQWLMMDYERIQAKKTAGEELTEEDKKFLASIETLLAPYQASREEITANAAVQLGENYYSVEGFQSAFDEIATQIGETQGITDFAASFDQATQMASVAEAFNQGGNALSGVLAAAQLIGLGPWNLALAVAVLASSGLSTAHAIEQAGYAADAQVAITGRKGVETTIGATRGVYNENLTYLEAGLDTLKNTNAELLTGDKPEE